MAMTKIIAAALALSATLGIGACRRAPMPAEETHEPQALSVTRWTPRTELFAEYPTLVAGNPSRFAIHLTRLDTFKPVTEGRVEVHLRGGRAAPEVFQVEGPSRPGIFGVTVKPAQAGRRELIIVLRSAAVSDEHAVGEVDVHSSAEAARADVNGGEDAGGISFLKEQQWVMDFATMPVAERSLQESLRVPAQIAPRPGGSADVVSPIAGRLSAVRDATLGSAVTRGQELARVAPPATDPAELPQLHLLRAEAVSVLAFATRDRARAERLVTAGAAPAKRLDEARTAEAQAQARVTAADARIAQHNAARGGSGSPRGAFVVRAPLTGTVAYRDATAGANVTSGTVLFRVVDAANVHVVGRVPEADAPRAVQARTAELEIPGAPDRIAIGRLVSLGRVLDPQARTVPIVFAFDNRTRGLPVGQAVFLHLLFGAAAPQPVVPASALVDDAGRPVVYVQREGETFERRPVTLGPRAGDLVQVFEGVEPGDRVVIRGAHLVRLASLSTQAPAHGHVH